MPTPKENREFFEKHVTYNRAEIMRSQKAGCYHCLRIFLPSEIKEWEKNKNGDTAYCPYCGIDTVYGDASGTPVDIENLKEKQQMKMYEDERVFDVVLKALTQSHLSVSEISILPEGKIRKSIVLSLVETMLNRENWFLRKMNELVPGYFIEKRKEGYILHTVLDNEIVRTSNLGDLHKEQSFKTLEEVVEAYLRSREGNLDGIEIDWNN